MLAGPAQALAAHSISPIIPILSKFSPMLLTARDLQSGDFDFACMCFMFWFEWFTKVLQETAGEVPKNLF